MGLEPISPWQKAKPGVVGRLAVTSNVAEIVDETPITIQADGEVFYLATNPDGTLIASALGDRGIQIWNADNGELATRIENPYTTISVTWNPDGTQIASGSIDNTVAIWSATTGNLLKKFKGHDDSVNSVAWSPDGTQLASGSRDGTTKIWAVTTGNLIKTLEGHDDSVHSVAWSPDGTQIASASSDETIKIWAATTGNLIKTLGHDDSVYFFAWSPDGMKIASGSDSTNIKIWDATTGNLINTISSNYARVFSIAWRPGGIQLALGYTDGTVKIWDTVANRLVKRLRGYNDWVYSVAWSPDGTRIFSGSVDKTIKIWNVASDSLLDVELEHSDGAGILAWSPDGKLLATETKQNTIQIWDVERRQVMNTLYGHQDLIHCLAWDPNGQRLASGSADADIRIWNVETGQLVFKFDYYDDYVKAIAWNPGGTLLASAANEQRLVIWNTDVGNISKEFAYDGFIQSLAWSPNGTQLAAGLGQGSVVIKDFARNDSNKVLLGHSADVETLEWSPDGRWLASGSDDQTIVVWDVFSGRKSQTLSGHTDDVNSVTWSPDSTRLASGSLDNLVKIWDPATGKVIKTLQSHVGSVISVAWRPNGMQLASASSKKIKIWNVQSLLPNIPRLASDQFALASLLGLLSGPTKNVLARAINTVIIRNIQPPVEFLQRTNPDALDEERQITAVFDWAAVAFTAVGNKVAAENARRLASVFRAYRNYIRGTCGNAEDTVSLEALAETGPDDLIKFFYKLENQVDFAPKALCFHRSTIADAVRAAGPKDYVKLSGAMGTLLLPRLATKSLIVDQTYPTSFFIEFLSNEQELGGTVMSIEPWTEQDQAAAAFSQHIFLDSLDAQLTSISDSNRITDLARFLDNYLLTFLLGNAWQQLSDTITAMQLDVGVLSQLLENALEREANKEQLVVFVPSWIEQSNPDRLLDRIVAELLMQQPARSVYITKSLYIPYLLAFVEAGTVNFQTLFPTPASIAKLPPDARSLLVPYLEAVPAGDFTAYALAVAQSPTDAETIQRFRDIRTAVGRVKTRPLANQLFAACVERLLPLSAQQQLSILDTCIFPLMQERAYSLPALRTLFLGKPRTTPPGITQGITEAARTRLTKFIADNPGIADTYDALTKPQQAALKRKFQMGA